MKYYYNQVPGESPWRNNLIYTSLISEDKKVFCQWYHNDSDYHQGQNEVIDQTLMEEKWDREVKFLILMSKNYPDLVPEILDIQEDQRKIYLAIDSVDFWQQSLDKQCDFDQVLPDWREQMLNILHAHRSLGLYKYSMHPSSYFIVNGKLKSINYFFTYHESEPLICIRDVESHIHSKRQVEMKKYVETLGIGWDTPQSFNLFQMLCWESFRTNYPEDFIEKAKKITSI